MVIIEAQTALGVEGVLEEAVLEFSGGFATLGNPVALAVGTLGCYGHHGTPSKVMLIRQHSTQHQGQDIHD